MPFIDSKVTSKLTNEQKEEIKTELGQLITTLGKSENYLMVGIEDAYDLWLAGKKLEKGAYVAVSLYGGAPAEAYTAERFRFRAPGGNSVCLRCFLAPAGNSLQACGQTYLIPSTPCKHYKRPGSDCQAHPNRGRITQVSRSFSFTARITASPYN